MVKFDVHLHAFSKILCYNDLLKVSCSDLNVNYFAGKNRRLY